MDDNFSQSYVGDKRIKYIQRYSGNYNKSYAIIDEYRKPKNTKRKLVFLPIQEIVIYILTVAPTPLLSKRYKSNQNSS